MGDYHDVYFLTDVFLLADAFENFRKICVETYDLDPSHYYTAPGLVWDAALKFSQIKLVLGERLVWNRCATCNPFTLDLKIKGFVWDKG